MYPEKASHLPPPTGEPVSTAPPAVTHRGYAEPTATRKRPMLPVRSRSQITPNTNKERGEELGKSIGEFIGRVSRTHQVNTNVFDSNPRFLDVTRTPSEDDNG